MSRSEVIRAFNYYGNIATRKQLESYIGSNQQKVINRMRVWGEITAILSEHKQRGGREWVFELVI